MAELIIQTGKHQGKKIELAGQDCLIGRHESCKIRIASGEVSKQHCRLKHKEGGLHAKDLGSRNGTFVNDKILDKEVLLKPGDLLRVGPMTFLVSEGKSLPNAEPDVPESSPAAKTKQSLRPEPKTADDDLIASWLSEGDLEKSGEDSTIVMPSSGDYSQPENKTEQTPIPSGEGTIQESIKQRAEEIIRRHHREQGKG